MDIQQKEIDNNIQVKFEELLLNLPTQPVFLPDNFLEVKKQSDFIYQSSTRTLKKILKAAEFPIDRIESDNSTASYLHQKKADWIAPTILFVGSVLESNPNIINVYINLISAYIYDLFKGEKNNKKVKLRIIFEERPEGALREIEYEGDSSGLDKIPQIIKETKK